MSSAREEMIKCPFWVGPCGTHQINCEGLVPDSNACVMFSNRAQTEQHLHDYCWADYQGCEMYQAIQAKYDRDKARSAIRPRIKDPCTECPVAADWLSCDRRQCPKAAEYWNEKWRCTTELFKK